jgi:hypothetical protein
MYTDKQAIYWEREPHWLKFIAQRSKFLIHMSYCLIGLL